MLSVEDLHCSYGPIEAVRGLSLEAPTGSLICILGPNGAGKSTTLKAIAGLVRPWRGKVRVGDQDVTRLDAAHRLSRGVALAPEGRRIFADFSVQDNLRIGGHLLSRRDLDARIKGATELFPFIGERMNQPGGSLSGGEQQMLAIARALMTRPSLLLLDEPSLGLSPIATRQVFDTVARIRKEEGTTVVLVEQNSLALSVADHGYVLSGGRLDLEAPARELFGDERLRRAYLGADA
ncbi:MAG: ABC transporter ATP-binding protein [Solirubrobacteraceae bacterium]